MGYSQPELARDFVIRMFGDEVLCLINRLYEEAVSPSVREAAFRIFDTPDGLIELHNRGWVIANHSAAIIPSDRTAWTARWSISLRSAIPPSSCADLENDGVLCCKYSSRDHLFNASNALRQLHTRLFDGSRW